MAKSKRREKNAGGNQTLGGRGEGVKASSLSHAVGEADLHLLQEVRLRDGSDGRKFSEHWPDSRARRLQSPHHQSRIDETAFRIARAGRAKTYPRKSKKRRCEMARVG